MNVQLSRLKKVLLQDNLSLPSGVSEAFLRDVTTVLDSYFSLTEPPTVQLTLDESSSYRITVTARADEIKKVKTV